eukprot:scaffold7698_cov186-Alexandrium_tamarense.AAC.2
MSGVSVLVALTVRRLMSHPGQVPGNDNIDKTPTSNFLLTYTSEVRNLDRVRVNPNPKSKGRSGERKEEGTNLLMINNSSHRHSSSLGSYQAYGEARQSRQAYSRQAR